MCVAVAQYSSGIESPASPAGDIVGPAAMICSSQDDVLLAAAGPCFSSCCYDGTAVGGVDIAVTGASVPSHDSWCPAGHSGSVGRKLMDTCLPSSDSEDLAELFSRIGLGKYTDIFQQQEVSSSVSWCIFLTFHIICVDVWPSLQSAVV